MNDPQIREILQKTELAHFISDTNSKVVEELKLPIVKARIDIAVINGHLHGYEIKSAQDTLQRLPSQLLAYSKVFDFLTVVTENKYHERILGIIPDWVGVSICSDKLEEDQYKIIKPSTLNNNKEGFHIAKLLWHSELVEVLAEQNIPFKNKQRTWILCELIAANIEINLLSDIVRHKLKQRNEWKVKEGY